MSLARIRDIFLAVADLPAADRPSALDAMCGPDAILRDKVWRMLAQHEGHSAFLDEPATLDGVPLREESDEEIPSRIGPYGIIERLGEGGFGIVYRARQERPIRRDVALKVIRAAMSSRQVVARFEVERQMLASLVHPNIARVYDAGETEDGRPYCAMELVEGEPIGTYCDAHRLGLDRRIELMVQICAAVEHAHQRGIIHRDLKPANILVTEGAEGPSVRVIDFGIARAVEGGAEGAAATVEARLLGTPDYMSPEQVDHRPGGIDVRVDVYALGTLLYELLTSETPLRIAAQRVSSLAAIVRTVSEAEPELPSVRIAKLAADRQADVARDRGVDARRLRSQLVGDLDAIVMKAIEKSPDRRYPSVAAFAEDIGRYRRGEPILAARSSATDRARKFVRRHRVGVVATAAVLVTLAAGFVMTAASLARAVRAERQATLDRDQAEAVSDFLVDDILGAASPERDGYQVTVVDAMGAALANADRRFAERPVVAARVRYAIGHVYRTLGRWEEAIAALEPAAGTFTAVLGREHALTIATEVARADALRELNRDAEAEAILRPTIADAEAHRGPFDPLTLKLYGALGELLQKNGRHDEAEPMLRRTLDRLRAAAVPDPETTLATTLSLVASLAARGRDEDALPFVAEALTLARRLYPERHPAVLAAMNTEAAMLTNIDRHADAERAYARLLTAVEGALPPGHWQIALVRYSLGLCLMRQERFAEAAPHIDQAVGEATAALGADHAFTRRMIEDQARNRSKLEAMR